MRKTLATLLLGVSLFQACKEEKKIPIEPPSKFINAQGKFELNQRARDLLKEEGIPEQEFKNYNKRFFETGPYQILKLYEKGIKPETANNYSDNISSDDVLFLWTQHLTPEIVNKYQKRFLTSNIPYENVVGIIPSEVANSYPSRFNSDEVETFYNEKIMPGQTKGFDGVFSGEDIVELVKANIQPSVVNPYSALNKKYEYSINSETIIKLIKLDIKPGEIEAMVRKKARERILDQTLDEILSSAGY